MTQQHPSQKDVDRLAQELYQPSRRHVAPCLGYVSLFNELTGRCPHCGSLIVAGPGITPEHARQMLTTLTARRKGLGLVP